MPITAEYAEESWSEQDEQEVSWERLQVLNRRMSRIFSGLNPFDGEVAFERDLRTPIAAEKI